MADDAGPLMPAYDWERVPICPWCSTALPAPDAADCPSCQARLVEPLDVEIPGVTAVDPLLLAAAAAPRRVKRTFGSLLVGDDSETPPPSEAEMPALARPDADVRREILRLEMEARLVALRAEVAARNAEVASETTEVAAEPTEAAAAPAQAPAPEPDTTESVSGAAERLDATEAAAGPAEAEGPPAPG